VRFSQEGFAVSFAKRSGQEHRKDADRRNVTKPGSRSKNENKVKGTPEEI